MSGLHPTDVKKNYKDELEFCSKLFKIITIMLLLVKLELIFIGTKLI